MPENNRTRKEFEAELITKAWKDAVFKQELLSNPKAVYARELGQQLPENLQVQVMEEDDRHLYLALPKSPQVSEEITDEALEAIAGGGGTILVEVNDVQVVIGW